MEKKLEMQKNNSPSSLKKAIELLQSDPKKTCVLAMGETVYTSEKRGIQPMLEFFDQGLDINGFAVADKIVGKAAALLFAHAGIKLVFAEVLSERAIPIFKQFGISFCFDKKTPQIENRKGDGICPMEQAVENINQPKQALEAIKQKLKDLTAPTSKF